MGKRKKWKSSARSGKEDPLQEQDRLRQAVLQVFRARVSSPGGGPAIILPTEKMDKSMDDLQLMSIPNPESSEEEMITVDKPVEKVKKTSQKEKKRKAKGEKNKAKEERNKCHAPVDRQARSEFRKHVKRADEIVSKSKLGRESSLQNYSSITQSRLTRRLGLYNQGKKSERVLREPLPVNKRVLKRTEKDLKKILDSSNDLIEDVEQERNFYTPRSASPSVPVAAHTSATEFPSRDHVENCHSINSQPSDKYICDDTSSEKVQKNEKVKEKIRTTPQEPDLTDVAEQLCGAIDLSVFPGRDLFSEIQTELMRTLVINSRMTPSKLTPAIKRQAKTSQSARRSLNPLMSSAGNVSHTSNSGSLSYQRHSNDVKRSLLSYSSCAPCINSNPDETSIEFFLDGAVGRDSGNYSEHGTNSQSNAGTSCFANTTILDFADTGHSEDLTTNYSLSGIDVIRKNEEAMISAKQMSYSSSLDFLDEMDKGPLHSTVPYTHFESRHKTHPNATRSLFSQEFVNYPNDNPRCVTQLTTDTADLFYEPALIQEMSPININTHVEEGQERRYGCEVKEIRDYEIRERHRIKRRCRHHESDSSDDSPILCYKCLDPIQIPNISNGYSPKFHPQKMY